MGDDPVRHEPREYEPRDTTVAKLISFLQDLVRLMPEAAEFKVRISVTIDS